MVFVEYRDSISAHHLLQSQLDCSLQVHLAVDLRVFDELNEHFGICVGLIAAFIVYVMLNKKADERYQAYAEAEAYLINHAVALPFGSDTAGLNKAVQEQAKKGIFNIPDNMLSEQIVYTHLIYKHYGLQSPVEDVLNAKQKISAEQQKSLEQAVKTAGQDGAGVKKIAASIAAKSGKKLGRYSAYDHASKSLKNAYITNLKQVRELNHR